MAAKAHLSSQDLAYFTGVDVELPVDDARTLLRSAATRHVRT